MFPGIGVCDVMAIVCVKIVSSNTADSLGPDVICANAIMCDGAAHSTGSAIEEEGDCAVLIAS